MSCARRLVLIREQSSLDARLRWSSGLFTPVQRDFQGGRGDREPRGRRPRCCSDLDPRRLSKNARGVFRENLSLPLVLRGRSARHRRHCRLHVSDGARRARVSGRSLSNQIRLHIQAEQGPLVRASAHWAAVDVRTVLAGCTRRAWRRGVSAHRHVSPVRAVILAGAEAPGAAVSPEGLGTKLGERSICGTRVQLEREISLSEGNVKCSRGGDPHEVRARERFTFPEGPTTVQFEKETKPLPLGSLSPCLPVNLAPRACGHRLKHCAEAGDKASIPFPLFRPISPSRSSSSPQTRSQLGNERESPAVDGCVLAVVVRDQLIARGS